MILIVVATSTEARHVINHYQLKKVQDSPFQIWETNMLRLIISGIGKVPTASAVGYLFAISNTITAIINFGIAGHMDAKIGECILVHKIIDDASKQNMYPSIWFNWNRKSDCLTTFDLPQTDYIQEGLYDMEGSAFFKASSKFIYIDCIHLLKIVSDNREESLKTLSKEKVLLLLGKNMEILHELIISLNTQTVDPLKNSELNSVFLKKWHFTASQKIQLNSVLARLEHMREPVNIEELYFCSHAKQVLKILNDYADNLH